MPLPVNVIEPTCNPDMSLNMLASELNELVLKTKLSPLCGPLTQPDQFEPSLHIELLPPTQVQVPAARTGDDTPKGAAITANNKTTEDIVRFNTWLP